MIVVVSIVIAVLVLGPLVALAIVQLGSVLAPGSQKRISRAYRKQRADLRAVLSKARR